MADELASVVITSEHMGDWWRSIAVTALRVLRPFLKLDATQSAAWDIVTGLLGGAT